VELLHSLINPFDPCILVAVIYSDCHISSLGIDTISCDLGPEAARLDSEGTLTSYLSCSRNWLPSHRQDVQLGTFIRVDPTRIGVVLAILQPSEAGQSQEGWFKLQLLRASTTTVPAPLQQVSRLKLTNNIHYVDACCDLPLLHVIHDCENCNRADCNCRPPPVMARGQALPLSFTSDPFRGHDVESRPYFLLNPFFLYVAFIYWRPRHGL
jgi:hypothetical protein